MKQEQKPVMLSILSQSELLLNELKSSVISNEFELGNVTKTTQVDDYKFDPISASIIAYKVIGVIGTIGGTVKFIDWLFEKLKSKTPKNIMQIKIGETNIQISNPESLSDTEIDAIIAKVKDEINSKK